MFIGIFHKMGGAQLKVKHPDTKGALTYLVVLCYSLTLAPHKGGLGFKKILPMGPKDSPPPRAFPRVPNVERFSKRDAGAPCMERRSPCPPSPAGPGRPVSGPLRGCGECEKLWTQWLASMSNGNKTIVINFFKK